MEVPACLKWKKGERDALRFLTSAQWKGVMPVIELLPPDDTNQPADLDGIAKQLTEAIPTGSSAFIDMFYIYRNAPKVLDRTMTALKTLRKKVPGRNLYPVLSGLADAEIKDANSATKASLTEPFPLLLRFRLSLVSDAELAASISRAKGLGIAQENLHLLVDQGSILGSTVPACVALVTPYLASAASTQIATAYARAVLAAVPPGPSPVGLGPTRLAENIRRYGGGVVSLESLVGACWSVGIPVVPLPNLPVGLRKMDGAVLMLDERPCIVISKKKLLEHGWRS